MNVRREGRPVWLGAACAGFAIALSTHDAGACSCLPSSVESSYAASSDVINAVPLLGFFAGSERRYLAQVTSTFKGCAKPGRLVLIGTPGSSAACGAQLELGTEYLLNTTRTGSVLGAPKLSITLCGYNLPSGDLSEHDRDFLDSRSVCCGDECTCADGTQPVSCFVNPCDVAPACEEAVRCEANYCGGCTAELYDANGAPACQPEPTEECAGDADCFRTGCSGQICAAESLITTCEFREEFACYQDPAITTCGCQEGHCAFAATAELSACLEAAGSGGP